MVSRVVQERDPYPFPKFENDNTLQGSQSMRAYRPSFGLWSACWFPDNGNPTTVYKHILDGFDKPRWHRPEEMKARAETGLPMHDWLSIMRRKPDYLKPTHEAQKQAPWSRLSSHPTLSSARREVYHFDEKAPHDSLDFILKTSYNHHKELFRNKNQTLVQSETLGGNHGRILKNRIVHVPPPALKNGHPLRKVDYPKKEDLDSVEKMIEGPHSQTSNRGYSRKPDGGFFTA